MIDCSTCSTWLSSSVTPSAASTAVKPSSNGTPAATNAPNASTRMNSVTGTEVASALWKSSLTRVFTALAVLADAELADEQVGVCPLHRRGRRQRRRHTIL